MIFRPAKLRAAPGRLPPKTISAVSHIEFRGSYPSTAEVSNDAYCFSLSLPATFKKRNVG